MGRTRSGSEYQGGVSGSGRAGRAGIAPASGTDDTAPTVPGGPRRPSWALQDRYAACVPDNPAPSPSAGPGAGPLLTAELLSIGSELTVGETRDTNAGELARALTGLGVGSDA